MLSNDSDSGSEGGRGGDPSAEPLNNLGHLSSAVGHHVINAFAAAVSSAEIIRIKLASPTPGDLSGFADMIVNTALEAASVARRLIDYTRPITDIGEGSVLLHELIADYLTTAATASPAGDLAWQTDLAAVPAIRGHAVHLRTMLDLFLDNAREAMAPGTPTTVSFSTAVDGRGWVALEIHDSGRGMTPEVMERAVEPFFTTKPGQMGVGLSIANGIWRRHRGTLSLRSAPGEGTLLRLCVEPTS